MSEQYKLTGAVKVLQGAQTLASGFTKRELVVTVEDGKYPQEISIEFVQDKASLLDDVNEGDKVTVFFNIRGREYNGRYFNNLVGWKLEVEAAGVAQDRPPLPPDTAADGDDDTDPIPF